MKKLFLVVASGLIMSMMTPVMAKEIDVSKFCVDKFCLGDPASKFGGIVSFKKGFGGFDFPVPDCKSRKFEAFHIDQNPKAETFIQVTFSSFPKHLGEGRDSYYRISKIDVRFPEVSSSDYQELVSKIFSRTGVKPERKGDRAMFLGLRWRAPKGSEFGGIPVSDVDLGAGSRSAFSLELKESLLFNPGGKSSAAIRADQQGCTNKPPSL